MAIAAHPLFVVQTTALRRERTARVSRFPVTEIMRSCGAGPTDALFDAAGTPVELDTESQPRFRDVMHAGLRGVVAAMAMTGLRAMTGGIGLVEQTPPQAIVRQAAPAVLQRVPRGQRDAAIEAFHWGYGGVGGMAYGALPEHWRRPPWGALACGMVVWAGFELVLAPALGIGHKGGGEERAAVALDHLLYGLVLSGIR